MLNEIKSRVKMLKILIVINFLSISASIILLDNLKLYLCLYLYVALAILNAFIVYNIEFFEAELGMRKKWY